jgi:uncharacterized protein
MSEDLAVFPLHMVLFPGTKLPLRIFEQRYLRMVSECMQQGKPFVVSLIQGDGKEAGEVAGCFSVGCTAKIIDFNQGATPGILDIVALANERVTILNSHHEPDNLMRARIGSVIEESVCELPESFSDLKKLFDGVLKQNPALRSEFLLADQPISATQMSFYLSHLAPVSMRKKQKLLELTNTLERLSTLKKIFSQMPYTLIA